MCNILLYISTCMVVVSFIGYFIMILFGNKKITDVNGFDVTKDIISEYNSINVVESKGYFTMYNIKRKVIKLSTKCYYGNSISDISLSLIEAGISIVDSNKNKCIEFLRKIFSNIKILYIFPLISLIINHSTYNINDAKVSLLFIFLFSSISYILIDIKSKGCLWVSDNIVKIKNISEIDSKKIIDHMNRLLLFDKLILYGQLVMIVRFVVIWLI